MHASATGGRPVAVLVDGVDGPLLYARVDLVPDDAGRPVVLELALAEPSLFFSLADGSLDRFADALAARVSPPA